MHTWRIYTKFYQARRHKFSFYRSHKIYHVSFQDKDLISKFPQRFSLLTITEFRAFLGLWLMRGLWGQATSRLSNLYLPGALPIFSATMPRERFKWILRNLSFDGAITTGDRQERWRHDRLSAIRYVFETIVDRWARPLVPDEHLTIEEAVYNLYVTQAQNTAYNNGKPRKYGVNFKSLNAVNYPYTFNSYAYVAKPVDIPNQFYISGTDNYTKYLVDHLSERVVLTGRNLSMNQLYTSVEIAEWLHSKHNVSVVSAECSCEQRL